MIRGLALLACTALACAAQSIDRAEALWRAGDYRNANDAFRAAVNAQPKNADYRVRWGRFFVSRFQPKDAGDLFAEALKIDPKHAGAYLGLALVASESFESKAVEFATKALEIDPKSLEARELLARLALEDNDPKKAIEHCDQALAISPRALDAMAVRATIDWLAEKSETPWIGRILEIDPKYGKAYELAGHIFVLNRRYEEGIRFYQKAIELQPKLWTARSQLGVNLMRLGREAEAREQLEIVFNNGESDPATRNTLRLIDSYKNFGTFKTDNTVLKLHNSEAALLRPYFESELKRAIATFEKKYKFKLDRPVQFEVYPDHEDFAVRTLGMPGLGALGVTFGYVVAMDSPSGRKPGTFHWASTLWHELSHVFVLAATKHRVPRWFTEGMAVHEETAASPEWGDRIDPEVLAAIKDKKLLPVAELDRGFVRPRYPAQVTVSYFQAGRICDFIAGEWGYDKLLAMMHQFAGGAATPQVIETQLGLKPEEFDKRFLAGLETETGNVVKNLDRWRAALKEVAAATREKNYETVIAKGREIRDLYPDYVEAANVYEFLAEAYLAKGDKAAAAAELEGYAKHGGKHPAVLKKLAGLLEELGRKKDAARALARINYIYPLDDESHNKLGELWLSEGNAAGAILEFQAVVARKPHDAAAAYFNLARAYRAANRLGDAREQLISALEAAPGYRPAQKMLLELSQ
jgi:tetratricopeptide (TPR) repeat protein